MSHYRSGRDFEYRVRDDLAANGYEVMRAAGSKGGTIQRAEVADA